MYVLLFFACSFLGWCMEVACKLVQFGRFINRGFLLGPLCPIYGTGAVLMAYFLPPVDNTGRVDIPARPRPLRHTGIYHQLADGKTVPRALVGLLPL